MSTFLLLTKLVKLKLMSLCLPWVQVHRYYFYALILAGYSVGIIVPPSHTGDCEARYMSRLQCNGGFIRVLNGYSLGWNIKKIFLELETVWNCQFVVVKYCIQSRPTLNRKFCTAVMWSFFSHMWSTNQSLKVLWHSCTIRNWLFSLIFILQKLILRLLVCILLIRPMAPNGDRNQREWFPELWY